MAQPVRFDQDPEGPDGAGDFHFDTGEVVYAHEPEIASRLSQLSQRLERPDERTAANDGSGGSGGTSGRSVSDAGPSTATSGMQPLTPVGTDAPPPAPEPSPITTPMDPARIAEAAQAAASPPAQAQPKAPPEPQVRQPRMVYSAGRNPAAEAASAVPVPTTSRVSYEGQGAPYSAEDLQAREAMNQGVAKATMAQFDAQQASAENQAAQLRRQIPMLEFERAQAERELARKDEAFKVERAKAQTYVDAAYQRKIDQRALYHDVGVAGSIALVVGQALGAFGASLSHTDNYAARIVEQGLQQSIAAQEQEIQNGQIGANNLLARITDEMGGDVEQAKSVMKLASLAHVDAMVQEQAASSQSAEVQRAAQLWLAQNQQARLLEEQKFRDASIGKVTRSIESDMVVPRPGGARPMTPEEAMREDTKRYKSIAEYNAARASAEGGATDPELYIEGFGTAKSKKEAAALRDAIAEYHTELAELDETSRLARDPKAKIGISIAGRDIGTDEYARGKNLQRRGATTVARSYGGPITQSDREAAGQVVADPTRVIGGREDLQRIEVQRKQARERLNNKIREIVSGNHPDLPERRAKGDDD